MTSKRKTYYPKFKREAASLVLDKNYSHQQACNAMGVGYTAMNRWVKQLKSERGGNTPKSKAITDEQQKIQALEATIKQIKWENDILKKATALLVSDNI